MNGILLKIYFSYPTCVRSLGSGVNFSSSLIGSVAAPVLVTLGKVVNFNAMFFIGIVGGLGLITYFWFVETFGKKLQDEIEELSDENKTSVNENDKSGISGEN